LDNGPIVSAVIALVKSSRHRETASRPPCSMASRRLAVELMSNKRQANLPLSLC